MTKRGYFMSEKSQLILMSKYNQLMNQRMVSACSQLSGEDLLKDKGAFFKSILQSLNHILVGDILWLKRFSFHSTYYSSLKSMEIFEQPKRLDAVLFGKLSDFKQSRANLDKVIIDWCAELREDDLDKALTYKNFKGEEQCKRLGDLILHLFLHQIHHRGQITTLLSQEGIDFGETDLPEMIPEIVR